MAALGRVKHASRECVWAEQLQVVWLSARGLIAAPGAGRVEKILGLCGGLSRDVSSAVSHQSIAVFPLRSTCKVQTLSSLSIPSILCWRLTMGTDVLPNSVITHRCFQGAISHVSESVAQVTSVILLHGTLASQAMETSI
jgi:hypothetical protein